MNKIKLAAEVEQLFLDFHEDINTMEDILNTFNVSSVNKILADLCLTYFGDSEKDDFITKFADAYPPRDYDNLDEFKDAFNDIGIDEFVDYLFNNYSWEIARDFIHKLHIKQVESLDYLADEIKEYIYEEDIFPTSIADDCCDMLDKYKDEFKPYIDTVGELYELDDDVKDEAIVGMYPDVGYRDGCLVDIDGTIIYDFEDKTHSQLLGEYFGNEEVDTVRTDAKNQLRAEDITSYTFGHICNDIILIDEPTGTTVKDVVNDIKNSGLDYAKIYLWKSDLWEDDGLVERVASYHSTKLVK